MYPKARLCIMLHAWTLVKSNWMPVASLGSTVHILWTCRIISVRHSANIMHGLICVNTCSKYFMQLVDLYIFWGYLFESHALPKMQDMQVSYCTIFIVVSLDYAENRRITITFILHSFFCNWSCSAHFLRISHFTYSIQALHVISLTLKCNRSY